MIKTIAILIVMIAVNFLMALSISRAAKRVDYSLRKYFVQRLGYDDLGVQLPEAALKSEPEKAKETPSRLFKSKKLLPQQAYLPKVDNIIKANYKNNTLKQDYKAIKKISSYTPEHALECAKVQVKKDERSQDFKDYAGLLKLVDYDAAFSLNALSPDMQESLLRKCAKPEHQCIIDDFMSENTKEFDSINFFSYLTQMAAIYNSDYSIISGNETDEGRMLEDGTNIVFDDQIYEGAQVIYKNKMYDFSI